MTVPLLAQNIFKKVQTFKIKQFEEISKAGLSKEPFGEPFY